MNKRTMVMLGVLVVAVVVGYVAFSGIYPPRHGTEGTIGAANRYQSEQITDKDVALSDPETQAFIQSDVFHKIQTNAEFRSQMTGDLGKALATNPDLGRLLADAGFAQIAVAPEFARVIAQDNAKEVMTSTDLAKLLAQDGFRSRLTDLSRIAQDDGFAKFVATLDKAHATTPADLAKAVATSDNAVLKTHEWAKLSADAGFMQLLTNGDFQRFFASPENAKFVTTDAAKLLAPAENAKVIAGDSFRNSMKDVSDFNRIVTDGGLKTLVTSGDWLAASRSTEFGKVLASGSDLAKVAITE